MKRYLLTRLLWLPVTLLGILVFNFCLVSVLAKEKAPLNLEQEGYLTKSSHRPSEKLQAHFGLSESLFFKASEKPASSWKTAVTQTQLYCYLKHLSHLDFGPSDYYPGQSVTHVIWSHLKISMHLFFFAALWAFFSALTLGGVLAYHLEKPWAFLINLFLLLLYALPVYLLTPVLIEKILIPLQIYSGNTSFFSVQTKSTVAIFCLAYGIGALYARLSQSLFASAKTQMHIIAAKAFGVSPLRIWSTHLLRPVLAAFIPVFLGSLNAFLVGLILVENLLDIQGFGYLFYHALIQKDLAILLGCIFFASTLTLLSHLVADSLNLLLDPRAREHDYPAYQAYS